MSDDTTTALPERSLPPRGDARAETRKDARAGVMLVLMFVLMLLGGWAVLVWSKG